jgi:RNA polymerase sigma-70 factor (ECF subfamily)
MVKNFDWFRGDERQFRNWLYSIATNAVNNHLRKAARHNGFLQMFLRRQEERVVELQTPDEPTDEEVALLKKAMLTLKPGYQAIITLRFFENLKLTEIAEVLSTSAGTVRSQLARALAQLRKQFSYAQETGREV